MAQIGSVFEPMVPVVVPAEITPYWETFDRGWREHQERWHRVLKHHLEPEYTVGMFNPSSVIDFIIQRGDREQVFLELKGKRRPFNESHGDGKLGRLVMVEQEDYEKYLKEMWRYYTKVVVLVSYPDCAGYIDLLNSQPVEQHLTTRYGTVEWACWERQFHFRELPKDVWQPDFADFHWDRIPGKYDVPAR